MENFIQDFSVLSDRPVRWCEIDEKGACGGDCRMRDETCARYKVVPGDPDPWPNQEAYSDGSGSWKCKCVSPTALNINDMVIDNFSRDDLESKVAQLSGDELLDNFLQIEVTNDMIANFQAFDAHESDCVFGILNYLKLVPRRVNLNIAAQYLRGANTAEMVDFFSEILVRKFPKNRKLRRLEIPKKLKSLKVEKTSKNIFADNNLNTFYGSAH